MGQGGFGHEAGSVPQIMGASARDSMGKELIDALGVLPTAIITVPTLTDVWAKVAPVGPGAGPRVPPSEGATV